MPSARCTPSGRIRVRIRSRRAVRRNGCPRLPPFLRGTGAAWTLDALLGAFAREDRRQGRAHTDIWLGVLLARAAGEGEEAQLAARVVVQAMLPSAARTARSLLRSDGRQFIDVAQAVVACA